MKLKYDVFISYSRAGRKVAEGVCGYLEANGLRCFIDYRDIPRSAVRARLLPDAISSSGVTVAVLTPDYDKSLQADRELAISDKAGIPVLPFRICDVPSGSVNWLDAFPDLEKVFGGLLADVLALKEATDNWTRSRNPALGGVTINLDSIDSGIELSCDVTDPACEDDYNDGVDALRHLEYADAMCYLLEPALAGYRQSQLYVSWIAGANTIGLVPAPVWDKVRAFADRENPFAEYLMSRYYSTLDVDHDLAFGYAAGSARRGNIFGRYALAKLYDLGEGTEHDDRLGIDIIKELERLDFAPAMREVARHYIYGFSGSRNPRRALKILERGVDGNSAQCMCELGLQKLFGRIMPADVDGARELLEQAIDEGFADAMGALADSYLIDYANAGYNKNPEDYKKLLDILNKGVRLNLPQCMSKLAFIYRNCASVVGLKKDLDTAVKWYKRAARLCDKQAASALGQIYYWGEGSVEADEPQAWKWFKKAASLVSGEAEYFLGMMCLDGFGQEGKTEADCVSFFENSIFHAGWGGGVSALQMYALTAPYDFERGFPTAPVEHLSVKGVERSEEAALGYLKKGADIDNVDCCYLLGCALTDPSRPYSDEIEGVAMLEKALSLTEPCYDAALRLYELYTGGFGVGADTGKADRYLQLAKEHLTEETFNGYMSRREANRQSTPAPASAKTEEGRLNYERALPLCREGASYWELIRGLSYIELAKTAGYADAYALYRSVMCRLRDIYNEIIAGEHPDFRILAQLLFAPLLQTDIPDEFRQKAFDDYAGSRLKILWESLKGGAATLGIYDFPEPGSDFLADAEALNRLWWQLREKYSDGPVRLDCISPMIFNALYDRAEYAHKTDKNLGKFLEDFADTIVRLDCVIRNALEYMQGG